MSKSKIVLVVDVCSGSLSTAVTIMSQYLSERLYNFPENMISLVLVGTVSVMLLDMNVLPNA